MIAQMLRRCAMGFPTMQKAQRGINLWGLLVVVLAGLLLTSSAGGFAFKGFASLIFLATVMVYVAVFTTVNRGRKSLLVGCVPLLACLIPIALMTPTVFPTHFVTLGGARFEKASLVSVLSHIADEREELPTWRFYIADRDLAHSLVSVEIPDGCRLGKVLDIVADASGCEYDWYWHSGCGNAPSPGCAIFCFRRRGTMWDHSSAEQVHVYEHWVNEPDEPTPQGHNSPSEERKSAE